MNLILIGFVFVSIGDISSGFCLLLFVSCLFVLIFIVLGKRMEEIEKEEIFRGNVDMGVFLFCQCVLLGRIRMLPDVKIPVKLPE